MINFLILSAAAITAYILTRACEYAEYQSIKRQIIRNDLIKHKCKVIERFAYGYFRTIYDDKKAKEEAHNYTKQAFRSGLINEKYELLRAD